MTDNEIGKIVVDCAFKVHQKLGPGLLESVYEVAVAYEIKKRGLIGGASDADSCRLRRT